MGIKWSDSLGEEDRELRFCGGMVLRSMGDGTNEVFATDNGRFAGLHGIVIHSPKMRREQDFGSALEKTSPSSREFEIGSGRS